MAGWMRNASKRNRLKAAQISKARGAVEQGVATSERSLAPPANRAASVNRRLPALGSKRGEGMRQAALSSPRAAGGATAVAASPACEDAPAPTHSTKPAKAAANRRGRAVMRVLSVTRHSSPDSVAAG